jgi:nucleotide-binding universal stress UspA family protein
VNRRRPTPLQRQAAAATEAQPRPLHNGPFTPKEYVMFKSLLATDGSQHAERATRFLLRVAATGMPIEVVILNVQPEVVDWQTHGLAKESMTAQREFLGSQATEGARRLIEAAGIGYTVHVVLGDPAKTIVDFARQDGFDWIVMGTRGMGAFEGLALGSVAHKVVHLATVPVTLVK